MIIMIAPKNPTVSPTPFKKEIFSFKRKKERIHVAKGVRQNKKQVLVGLRYFNPQNSNEFVIKIPKKETKAISLNIFLLNKSFENLVAAK